MNIQPVSQNQQTNFGKTSVFERKLVSIKRKKRFQLVPRDAVKSETKDALEAFKALLDKPFRRVERSVFDSTNVTVVEILTEQGDYLALTHSPWEHINTIDRTVYENQKRVRKVSIDDTTGEGEMSKKERTIFEQIVARMFQISENLQPNSLC